MPGKWVGKDSHKLNALVPGTVSFSLVSHSCCTHFRDEKVEVQRASLRWCFVAQTPQ